LHIINYETNLSAEQKKANKNPWIQGTDENQGRQKGSKQKKKKGPETSGRRKINLPENKGRFGLGKKEIIRNKKEIKNLLSTGKRFACNKLIIIYKPASESKVGFFASGKIRSAVKRNRVKRILREAYRMNKEIFKGLNVIFYAHNVLDARKILDGFQLFRKEYING